MGGDVSDRPPHRATAQSAGDGRASDTVGVIGVGEIGAALVEALVASGPTRIVLSPRSRDRSAALARRHPQVTVVADNQAVADAADIVILAVLPEQVESVCAAMTFRAGQLVVGLPAGYPPSRLRALVAPAREVCQLIPLPMVVLRTGPIVLYPRIDRVAALVASCGTIVVPAAEDQLPVFSCASAVMSSYFAAQRVVTDWMAGNGIDAGDAGSYVTALLAGLAAEGVASNRTFGTEDPQRLIDAHETPGGLNEQLRRDLTTAGVGDLLRTGLDALTERLSAARHTFSTE